MTEFLGILMFFGVPGLFGLAGLLLAVRHQASWVGRLIGVAMAGLAASVIWIDAIMWNSEFECFNGACGRWYSVAEAVVGVFFAAVLVLFVVAVIRWMFPRDRPRGT
jgi:hypothetical protein